MEPFSTHCHPSNPTERATFRADQSENAKKSSAFTRLRTRLKPAQSNWLYASVHHSCRIRILNPACCISNDALDQTRKKHRPVAFHERRRRLRSISTANTCVVSHRVQRCHSAHFFWGGTQGDRIRVDCSDSNPTSSSADCSMSASIDSSSTLRRRSSCSHA